MKRSAFLCTSGGPFLALLLMILTPFTVGITGAVRADTVTFAQFTQRTVSDQAFAYSSNGSSANLGSMSGGIPIFLTITDGFGPNQGGVESAHLFLVSSTTASMMSPVTSDGLMREHFNGVANSIQIILDTPVNGKNDFLTVRFSDALLSGRSTSSEASLKGSDTPGGKPGQVSFSSDFIDFSNATEHGFRSRSAPSTRPMAAVRYKQRRMASSKTLPPPERERSMSALPHRLPSLPPCS